MIFDKQTRCNNILHFLNIQSNQHISKNKFTLSPLMKEKDVVWWQGDQETEENAEENNN